MLPASVKKLILSLGTLLITIGTIYASDPNHVVTAPSGLSSSLGDTLTSVGFDASSSFYNPATIMTQGTNVYLEHTKKNLDAASSWLAVAGGNTMSKYGFSWNHLSLPLDSHRDQAFLTMAFKPELLRIPKLPPSISFGLNVGVISNKIADESASAYFLDIGTMWSKSTADLGYGIGIAAKNLYFSGLQYRDEGTSENHPKQYDLGLHLRKKQLMGLINLDSADGESSVSYGLQYSPINLISFQAGFNQTTRIGLGINLKNMSFDYGYKFGEVTSDQTLSFNYKWNAPKETDYTNPLNELEARHKSLSDYLIADLQKNLQSLKVVKEVEVLKLIIVKPDNSEAWNIFNSLTGEKRLITSIPTNKNLRRDYLNLAVAYAEKDPSSKDLVEQFVKKYPNKRITSVVMLIKKYDYKNIKNENGDKK